LQDSTRSHRNLSTKPWKRALTSGPRGPFLCRAAVWFPASFVCPPDYSPLATPPLLYPSPGENSSANPAKSMFRPFLFLEPPYAPFGPLFPVSASCRLTIRRPLQVSGLSLFSTSALSLLFLSIAFVWPAFPLPPRVSASVCSLSCQPRRLLFMTFLRFRPRNIFFLSLALTILTGLRRHRSLF